MKVLASYVTRNIDLNFKNMLCFLAVCSQKREVLFLNTKIYFFPQDLSDKICGKVFTLMYYLNQHVRTTHESSSVFSCTQCDYTTPLKHHTKRHSSTPSSSNLPPKIACREPIPNIIDPLAYDNLLQDFENQEIQTTLEQNTQVGFGITQMTSTDETILHEI